MFNSARAGPDGLRRPCSQSCSVRHETPIRSAKAACESPVFSRTAFISSKLFVFFPMSYYTAWPYILQAVARKKRNTYINPLTTSTNQRSGQIWRPILHDRSASFLRPVNQGDFYAKAVEASEDMPRPVDHIRIPSCQPVIIRHAQDISGPCWRLVDRHGAFS